MPPETCINCPCWRCFNVFCPYEKYNCAFAREDSKGNNCFCSDCEKSVFIFSKEEAIQIIEEYNKRLKEE